MRRLFRFSCIPLLVLLAWGLDGVRRRAERSSLSPFPLTAPPRYSVPVARSVAFAPSTVPESVPLVETRFLERGMTLGQLLPSLGLTAPETTSLIAEMARFVDPRRLRSGARFDTALAPDGAVVGMELVVRGKGRLRLSSSGPDWRGEWREFERAEIPRRLAGRVDSSLEAAIVDAGGPAALAYEMAEVLQWDLDFNRDLRRGDEFTVAFDETFIDGEPFGVGAVRAVHYQSAARRLEAYRFGDHHYYDGDGRPLQKMFLKSPLRYSRVTSRYSKRRFHPVLKVYRAHHGVDYGAPVGTPVRATASGVVSFAGWAGGGGKTVRVRHPNGYETSYLHLSRFADSSGVGRRVAQGEVVGFVGSTGLATGAHLDYRVKLDGKWINPSLLGSEPAAPIPADSRQDFLTQRDALCRELETAVPARPLDRLASAGEAL